MRAKLFAAASVAALCAFAFTPAMAASPGGYIDGGYANSQFNHGFGHVDDWNLNGSAETPLGGSAVTLQGDGSVHSLHSSVFGTTHNTELDLSLILNGTMGKVGATVGRDSIGVGGPTSFDGTSYSAFGVLYPNSMFTLGIKGGAVNFTSGFPNISSWGGEVLAYPTANIAVGLNGDAANRAFLVGGHASNWALSGEWQPTSNPWSLKLGYDNTRFSGIGLTSNTWSLNLRWYFGGGSTLRDHHRNGAETWGTRQSGIMSIF
jgi:hypothetical protein